MKLVKYSFTIALIACFGTPLFAQRGGGGAMKWAKDGKSYYSVEGGNITQTKLPSFEKSTVIDSSQFIPAKGKAPLAMQSWSFSDDGSKVILFTNSKKVWRQNTRGDYWVLDTKSHSLKQLGKGRPSSSLMFAKLSPDGKKAAYSSEHNMYVEDLATGKITKLTNDGTARMINGTFDWVYEEEFSCRDGFRWSPDSKNIAYWQIDARKIKNFLLIDNTDSLYSFTKPVEYPKAGQDPSVTKVGVISLATGKTTWMKVPGDATQHYIPRMEWADNSSELVLEQMNRKQNEAKVFICSAATGAAKSIYRETDKAWIETKEKWGLEPTGWDWIAGGKKFIWVSEKDGWRHIYSLDRDGSHEDLLTRGDYDIIKVISIDEKGGYIYFSASPKSAIQSYLYRVAITGSDKPELLSPESQKGTHSYNVSPGALYATHSFSNYKGESASDWVSLADNKIIKNNVQAGGGRGGGRGGRRGGSGTAPKVEMFQVTTEDGVTMDGWIVKPTNFDSTKKYPVLFHVYAEPAGATVRDAAGSASTGEYAGDIAADGYIQMAVEGRGTPIPKGAAWRKSIYKSIGLINIRDQAMATRELLKRWKFMDPKRIAVYGSSGGGSTTLNLLFQYPEIYSTGIALAPVANQLLYDNIYEERYMGLPQENMDVYDKCSPITYAKNLKGSLLVIHGTGDDNVHYQGTEMLINALVKYDKKFQMMSYPNRTHALREGEGTALHISHLFTSFLNENCPGGGVPQ
jgi:dipeptidyl-peptidase-4